MALTVRPRLPAAARLLVALVALAGRPRAARADDLEAWNEALDRGLSSRRHTIAELELGAIVLPGAPISPAQRGGDLPAGLLIGKGDATLEAGVHTLYRVRPSIAIGVAVELAPFGTSDSGYGLGGSSGLSRTHSRDYFYIGGEGRWEPLHYKLFEGWVGVQSGFIIVADRFTTNNLGAYSPQLGAPQVNERTEGLSAGVQAGVSYSFGENFVMGFTLRVNAWFLPSTPQCSAIGDCATLTSGALAWDGGLLFGYRLPL